MKWFLIEAEEDAENNSSHERHKKKLGRKISTAFCFVEDRLNIGEIRYELSIFYVILALQRVMNYLLPPHLSD